MHVSPFITNLKLKFHVFKIKISNYIDHDFYYFNFNSSNFYIQYYILLLYYTCQAMKLYNTTIHAKSRVSIEEVRNETKVTGSIHYTTTAATPRSLFQPGCPLRSTRVIDLKLQKVNTESPKTSRISHK